MDYIISFLILLFKMALVVTGIGIASFFIYVIGRLLGLGMAKSFQDIFNRKESKDVNARSRQEVGGKNCK